MADFIGLLIFLGILIFLGPALFPMILTPILYLLGFRGGPKDKE